VTGTPPERPKSSDPKAVGRALKNAYLAMRSGGRSPTVQPRYICTNCGYAGQPVYETPGSGLFAFILFLCLIVPGLLYQVWRTTHQRIVCPKCRKQAMIPTSTPEGAARLRAVTAPAAGAIAARPERQCPWCAEMILAEARVCKHCGRDVEPHRV
jgi:hypothetical protein